MRRELERALLGLWRRIAHAEVRGGISRALWSPLRVLGALFGRWGSWRLVMYERGILRSTRVPPFVISVGNLSCGGSGKTPFCLMLAEVLRRSHRLAILSRGYRGTLSHHGTRVNDRLGALFGAKLIGDEPHLMAGKSAVPIFVDAHRVRGALSAIRECRPQVLIVDDGFQHQKLQRQCELLLIDASALTTPALCLPAGPMRNSWKESARADLIILTGLTSDRQWHAARAQVSKWSRAPVVGAQMQLGEFVPLTTWRHLHRDRARATKLPAQTSPPPRRVFVCCALAHPERFLQTLRLAGVEVVGSACLPDHAALTLSERKDVLRRASQCAADAVVCTEKDAVKWEAHPDDDRFLVACASMHLKYEEGLWRHFTGALHRKIENFGSYSSGATFGKFSFGVQGVAQCATAQSLEGEGT